MSNQLGDYLTRFKGSLQIDTAIKGSAVRELSTHLEDRRRELEESGLSEEDASRAAIRFFGPVQLVARQIYRVHSQGTWKDAFLAALPHLLVALLFATYYWQDIVCTSAIATVVTCTVIYGWFHDKPMWLFPWLGYYLLPVMVTGILLLHLPQGWGWLAAVLYLPFALFVIGYIVKQAASRDWLYVSLMLAPVPVACAWLLILGRGGVSMVNTHSSQADLNVPGIVTSLLLLAVASFSFMRVRPRWCKAAILLVSLSVVFLATTLLSRGNIGLWGWLVFVSSLLVVASPACLQIRS